VNRIAIISDSDCSIPAELSAQLGILQVPISVHFGNDTFYSGVDINDASLFARVDREGKLPSTSAPSPGAFSQAFQQAFDSGAEAIMCFCVSSKVSATYAAAVNAVQEFPGREIRVVDTLSVTMGQGYIVLAAAEAATQGTSLDEIEKIAGDIRNRTHLYAALATLKYLAMSGRIGYLAAGMANLLNIKPILTIQDGKLDLLERVRTQGKAWARVLELARQAAAGNRIERVSIVHVSAIESAHKFEPMLRETLAYEGEILYSELTPGLSVHTGAGLVGTAFVTER
jgi:DegV family protein with EDD domain